MAVTKVELAKLAAPEARLTITRFRADRPQEPKKLGAFSIAGHR